MYYMWFLFSIISVFLIGNSLLKIIDRNKIYDTTMEKFVISYALGIGAIAIIQFYMMFMRIPVNKTTILLIFSPFLVMQLYYLVKRIYKSPLILLVNKRFYIGERSTPLNILKISLIIYLVLLCLIILFICLFFPMYTYDSRATWAFKAKILFYRQTIFTDEFFDLYRFHPNVHYPLLVPLSESFFFNMLMKADDYLVKVIFTLFYICFIFWLYITQRKYFNTSRLHALVFTSVIVSTPFLFVIYGGSVPSAYADFVLTFFYTLNIILLFRYFQDHKIENLIMASLFALCVLFTKGEGALLFLISIIVFIIDAFWGRYFRKNTVRHLLLYVLLPLVILLPWFIISAQLPTSLNDANPLAYMTISNMVNSLPYIGQVIRLTLKEIFTNLSSWSVIWLLIFIAIGIKPKDIKYNNNYNPRLEAYLLFIPFFHYLFILMPFYIFYIPRVGFLEANFGGSTFERYWWQTIPLLLLFTSLKIQRLFQK